MAAVFYATAYRLKGKQELNNTKRSSVSHLSSYLIILPVREKTALHTHHVVLASSKLDLTFRKTSDMLTKIKAYGIQQMLSMIYKDNRQEHRIKFNRQ